jgi:prepilin-type N-terminal cleavage/methylation domain-containing protein
MSRSKSGFTLVELLVVIAIIGILVGLLIPAVNTLKERGRQAACLNNQRQLGLAILNYESNKRNLPGVMNQLTAPDGKVVPYSWVEAIFPNLDRADLWNKLQDDKVAEIQNLRVSVVVCPDDPNFSDKTRPSLLSYGVNDQFFVDARSTPPVDRNGKPVAVAVPSDLKTRPNASFPRGQTVTTTQIVMLGERTLPDTTSNSRAGNWPDTNWNSLAFPWPVSPPVPLSPAVMQSAHGSGSGMVVIVTYFDGHCAIIPGSTPFPYSPYP